MTDPKPLTPSKIRALEYLAQYGPPNYDSGRDFGTPRGMALYLWPDSKSWTRYSHKGVRGQFMPAKGGRVLSELRDLGYAVPVYPYGYAGESPRWFITNAGTEALNAAQQVATATPGRTRVKEPKWAYNWPEGEVTVGKPEKTYSTTSYRQNVYVDGELIGYLDSYIQTPRVPIAQGSRIGKDLKPRRTWQPHRPDGEAVGIRYENRGDAIARLWGVHHG